ncbi:MAG: hypothetical protein V3V78_04260 [Candidatus Woesearchaeota archaeon]
MEIIKLDSKLIRQSLDFFESELYGFPSRENENYMDNFNSFTGSSLKLIEEVLEEHLKKIPSILTNDEIEFIIDAHGQTFSNDLGLLPGQSGGALTVEGAKRSRDFLNEEYAGQIIISSDLPRAINSSIAKYFPEELESSRLESLIEATPASLDQDYGIIDPKVQLDWIRCALELGIIPTPLLRSQFYGLMELFLERPIEDALKKEQKKLEIISAENIESKIERLRKTLEEKEIHCYDMQTQRFKELNFDDGQIEKKLSAIKQALSKRADIQYCMRAEDRRQITELRADTDKRVNSFMGLLAPGGSLAELVMGKRIQIMSHSGTNDVLFEFLRRYEHPNEIHLVKRAKPKERGESMLITMDAPNEKIAALRFLNDPAPLEDAIEITRKEIASFREKYSDEQIRSGKSIMPTELYSSVLDASKNEVKNKVDIEKLLSDDGSYLILGNCGLGKTTFCLDLATKLTENESYVPVLIRLRDVKRRLDQEKKISNDDYDIIKGILSGGLSYLAKETIDSYKKQKKKFVFILDGYDELDPSIKNYKEYFEKIVGDLKDIGKVIVTSRSEQFSKYETENANLGYTRTLNVDQEAIVKHLDQYLEARLNTENEAKKLKEFILKQAPDIKNNWLMVHFITNLYQMDPASLDLKGEIKQSEIMKQGIEWFVWDHARRRDENLFSDLPKGMPGQTEEQYNAQNMEHMVKCKEPYIREVMPSIRKVYTYMAVNELQSISLDEAQWIIEHWSLAKDIKEKKGGD